MRSMHGSTLPSVGDVRWAILSTGPVEAQYGGTVESHVGPDGPTSSNPNILYKIFPSFFCLNHESLCGIFFYISSESWKRCFILFFRRGAVFGNRNLTNNAVSRGKSHIFVRARDSKNVRLRHISERDFFFSTPNFKFGRGLLFFFANNQFWPPSF